MRKGQKLPEEVKKHLSEVIKKKYESGELSRYNKGQFKKGHIPFNKGKKMPEEVYKKCAGTMFKKGNKPQKCFPINAEKKTRCSKGYIYTYVKVNDIPCAGNKNWKNKAHLIYEKAHNCTINPKKEAVIFLDGNRENFNIDNLFLVSRKELRFLNAKYNKIDVYTDNSELTKSNVLISRLRLKIKEKENKNEN
jgi:hypothetical protein